MNKLLIDTSDNKNVFAKITAKSGIFVAKSDSNNSRPDSIVNLIEEVLLKAKIKIKDIDKIEVNQGPGSYTGLKVGVSVASALSFSLLKKVNEKDFSTLIEPVYD